MITRKLIIESYLYQYRNVFGRPYLFITYIKLVMSILLAAIESLKPIWSISEIFRYSDIQEDALGLAY